MSCLQGGRVAYSLPRAPFGNEHSSVGMWKPIIEKFENRLAGWMTKMLSVGGKVTLLKSVVGSLSIFLISLFQLSKEVKKEVEKIKRRFLWSEIDEKRKVHYVGWDKICRYKEDGGLGVIDLEIKIKVLLNKWIWRYSSEKSSCGKE